ncbi:MAG: hypothetical protein QF682_12565 [Candidatus Thermoplasmatota archaeon]|nr:hypothetical protein [Candidatus Thermoplasmatota archaeon]
MVYNGTEYNIKAYRSTNPNFLYANITESGIVLKPGEPLQLVSAYNLEYLPPEKNRFGMTFYYNVSNILITFEPFENTKVEGEDNLELIYLSDVNKYVTQHIENLSRASSERLSFTFSKSLDVGDDDTDSDSDPKSSESSSKMLIIILIIIAIGLVLIIYIGYQKNYKRKLALLDARASSDLNKSTGAQKRAASKWALRERENEDDLKERYEKVETIPHVDERNKLTGEIKKILKTTERLKRDYKVGLISKEIFDDLRGEYKVKLKKIKKRIAELDVLAEESANNELMVGSKEMKELIDKKEQMLKAISKLEDDREAGILDEELYGEMVGIYKKQTIEILREIDRIKE